MTEWNPTPRPAWLEEVNRVGQGLARQGHDPVSFDINSLHAEARRNRGNLRDFGKDDYLIPLARLLRAIDEEAELHTGGALVTRDEIINALECRLWTESVYERFPEAEDTDLGQIIFIGGPGRSGTSIAHEALGSAPDAQFLNVWEIRAPWIHEMPEDAREQAKEKAYQAVFHSWYGLNPVLEVQHQMWPEMPQECAWALNQNFSTDYYTRAFLVAPELEKWAAAVDMVPTYEQYKRFLKAIQFIRGKSDKHWVLKTPQHVFALDALQKVFPDAHFVWAHRDPIKTLGSAMNFRRELAWSRSDKIVDSVTDGQAMLKLIPSFLEWTIDFHKKSPRSQISPLAFNIFMLDPAEALLQVRRDFGLPDTEQVRSAITSYMANRTRHPKGKHEYGWEEILGIKDIDEVQKPCQPYYDYLGLEREW